MIFNEFLIRFLSCVRFSRYFEDNNNATEREQAKKKINGSASFVFWKKKLFSNICSKVHNSGVATNKPNQEFSVISHGKAQLHCLLSRYLRRLFIHSFGSDYLSFHSSHLIECNVKCVDGYFYL